MAWLARDKNGKAYLFKHKPIKGVFEWLPSEFENRIQISDGIIELIIDKKLTWEDEPVEIEIK